MDKSVEALLNIQPHVSAYCRAMGVSLINIVNLNKKQRNSRKDTIANCKALFILKSRCQSHTINIRHHLCHETLLQSFYTPEKIFSLGASIRLKQKNEEILTRGELYDTHMKKRHVIPGIYQCLCERVCECVWRGKVMSAIAMETEPLCKFCLYQCFISLFH